MEMKSSKRPFELLIEKRLCLEILRSDYIKMFHKIKVHKNAIDEIYNQVNHVEPWMINDKRVPGHDTFIALTKPVRIVPSKAFCLLYKPFTMKLTTKQIKDLIDNTHSPYVRAIGFLYLRYVAEPDTLWTWYEPYIRDDEKFSPGPNGQMTTMGVYRYFGSPLPRMPTRVLQEVMADLKTMRLPTKLSGIIQYSSVQGSESGHAKSPPRKHRSQSCESSHDTERNHSEHDRPRHNVREQGRQAQVKKDLERDDERRRGSDRNGCSSGRRRSRSRSRERRDWGLDRERKDPGRNRRSRGRSGRSRSRSRSRGRRWSRGEHEPEQEQERQPHFILRR